MAGPGGVEVGRVSIRVVADASGLAKEVREALGKAQAKVKDLKAGFDVDASQLTKQVKSAVSQAQATAGKIDTGFDIDPAVLASNVRTAVSQAQATAGKIDTKFDVDLSKLIGLVRGAVAAAKAAVGTIEIGFKVATATLVASVKAAVKVAEMTAGRIRVTVETNINHTKQILTSMTQLEVNAAKTAASMTASFGAVIAKIGAIGTVAIGVTPAIAAIGTAAAQTLTPIAALTAAMAPAAIGSAAAGIGVIVTAFKGMKDALTDDEEAFQAFVDTLGENTAVAATEINGLYQEFSSLGTEIKEAFWGGVEGISNLSVLIEPFKESIIQLAANMGSVVSEFIAFVSQGAGLEAMNVMIGESSAASFNLFSALGQVLQAFTMIGAAAAPIFTQLTEGLATWATNWNAHMQELYESGGLTQYFQDAVDKAQNLWTFLGQLGSIVTGVFTAMQQAGVPFLGTLGSLVAAASEWINSASGMEYLVSLFGQTQAAVAALWPIIMNITGMLASQVIPLMSNIIQTLAPGVNVFLGTMGTLLHVLSPLIMQVVGALGAFLEKSLELDPVIRGGLIEQGFSVLVGVLQQVWAAVQALWPSFQTLAGILINDVVPVLSNIVQAIAPSFNVFLQGLQGMLQALAPAIQVVAGWFSNFLMTLSPLLPTIGELITNGIMWLDSVLQQLSPIIQTVVGWLSSFLTKAIEVAGGLLQQLTPAIQSVIGWVQNFITKADEVVTKIWNELQPAFNEAKRLLSDVLGTAINWVTGLWEKLSPILTTVAGQLSGALAQAIQFVTNLWNQWSPLIDYVAGILTDVLGVALQNIVPFIQDLLDHWQNLMDKLPPMEDIIAALEPWFDTIKDVIETLVPIVWDLAKKFGETLFYAIGKLVDPLKDLGEFVKKVWEAIKPTVITVGDFAGKLLDALKPAVDFVVEAFKLFLDIISPLIDVLKKLLEPINWLIDKLGGVVEWVGKVLGKFADFTRGINEASDAAGGFWNALGEGIKNGISNAVQWVSDLKNTIINGVKDLGSDLFNSGKSAITGFFNGMIDTFNGAISKVGDMVQSVRDFFPFSPAKVGPFSGHGWVLYSGEAIGEAFTKGMMSRTGMVANAARSMAMDASRQFGGLQASVSTGNVVNKSTAASVHVDQIVTADPGEMIRYLENMQFKALVRAGAI